MKKISLDTSVISAYFDQRKPERQKITQNWWNKILFTKFQVHIGRITLVELGATVDLPLREQFVRLVEKILVLEFTEEARNLAGIYLEEEIFLEKYRNDALCVAIGVVSNIDILASWNYAHLVNLETKDAINGINLLMGYREIIIESPLELGGGEYAEIKEKEV